VAVDNHLGQVTAVPTSTMTVRIDDQTLVVCVALSLKSQRLKMAWSFLCAISTVTYRRYARAYSSAPGRGN